MSEHFRDYLFPDGHPRIAELVGQDAYEYRETAKYDDFTGGLIRGWTPLYYDDFVGITSDGELRDHLFPLTPARDDERAPVEAMVDAANALLATLTDEQRDKISYDIEALEWRQWANPEFLQFDNGIRLEFCSREVQDAVVRLIEASLSESGARTARDMMRINGFLGDVVGLPGILGEWSYNVCLFGTPDLDAPWGWQLYGHHCAVNCMVVEGNMMVGPVFFGAEPNEIDEGPHAGTTSFLDRLDAARALIGALPSDLLDRVIAYPDMLDPAMPAGRIHSGDGLTLAGAFQDNRVIPDEGVAAAEFPPEARAALTEFIGTFLAILPDGPRRAREREVAEHLDETFVTWIGGTGDADPFYLRVQSPVAIFELDHHNGVFLDYDTPKVFHVHTIMRTPNGNDYGRAWVRQYLARPAAGGTD